MSADSEKPNIIGGNWTKYCTVAKSVGRGRPIWTSVIVRARTSLALCGWFNQFRSPYSWITMRRALRKWRVFDFVPSYLKRVKKKKPYVAMVRHIYPGVAWPGCVFGFAVLDSLKLLVFFSFFFWEAPKLARKKVMVGNNWAGVSAMKSFVTGSMAFSH